MNEIHCYFDGCKNLSTEELAYWCCEDHKTQWQEKNYGASSSKTHRMTVEEAIARGKQIVKEIRDKKAQQALNF